MRPPRKRPTGPDRSAAQPTSEEPRSAPSNPSADGSKTGSSSSDLNGFVDKDSRRSGGCGRPKKPAPDTCQEGQRRTGTGLMSPNPAQLSACSPHQATSLTC